MAEHLNVESRPHAREYFQQATRGINTKQRRLIIRLDQHGFHTRALKRLSYIEIIRLVTSNHLNIVSN